MTKTEWRSVNGISRNEVLDCGGFYVSYNPNPGGALGSSLGSDDGGPETALCKNGNFRILNGDFRDDYERLAADGFDACLSFYEANRDEHGSSWSDA